jgi:hypothetical protein
MIEKPSLQANTRPRFHAIQTAMGSPNTRAAAGTGARPGELWRHRSPYRGLSAMEEKDADYFLGR